MGAIEPQIVPLVLYILSNQNECGYDYIDNAVQMLSFLTYYLDDISSLLWTACGPLLTALDSWASDYITEIAAPLLTYMSKQMDLFLTGTCEDGVSFTNKLLHTIEQQLAMETEGYETEAKAGAVLATCLLTCARGRINEAVPKLLHILVLRLSKPLRTSGLKHALLDAVLASIYYDAYSAMALLKMDHESGAAIVFRILFETLPAMEKNLSQRLIVMAFSSMLALPLAFLPALASSNIEAMFRQIIRELVLIGEELKERDEDGEDMDDEDAAEEDEDADSPNKGKMTSSPFFQSLEVPEGGYDEDEDCINAEDETYREALVSLDKEERVKRQLYIDGEPVDGEDDDEEGFDYTSPLENADVLGYFVCTLHAVSAQDPALIARLQGALDLEDAERLKELVRGPTSGLQPKAV